MNSYFNGGLTVSHSAETYTSFAGSQASDSGASQKNKVWKSTRAEILENAGYVGASAAFLRHLTGNVSSEIWGGAAPLIPSEMATTGAALSLLVISSWVAMGFAMRSGLTKADPWFSPDEKEAAIKLRAIREEAKVYGKKLGFKKTPKIRVWRDKAGSFVGPACIPSLTGGCVAFSKDSLRDYDLEELKGILGHEMAHIRKKHGRRYLGSALMITSASVVSLWAPVVLFPLMRSLSRKNEFQADRIGALVSGNPSSFARYLEEGEGDMSLKDQENRWKEASLSKKMSLAAKAVSNGVRYAFLATHPSTRRRVGRLDNMANSSKKDQGNALKNRFLEFLP